MRKTCLFVGLVCLAFLTWTMSCQSPSSTGNPASSKVANDSQSNSINNDNSSNSDNDSGTSAGTGFLRLMIKDAPIEGATNIFVTISDIRIHGTGNNGDNWFSIIQDPPLEIDLLALKTTPLMLPDTDLPAGTYNQIRMTVDSGSIVFPDSPEGGDALTVPSDEIKTHLHFVLVGGMTIEVTLDFDAENSIHVIKNKNGSQDEDSYVLRPVVNAVGIKEVTGG